jgi:hypothetical protein
MAAGDELQRRAGYGLDAGSGRVGRHENVGVAPEEEGGSPQEAKLVDP